MKKIAYLFLILPFIAFAEYKPTPIPGTKLDCGKEIEPIEWSYCITTVPQSSGKKVLYHFHGRNGNATWWNDKTYHTGKIHSHWVKNKINPPTVISISFGKLWMLTKGKDNQEMMNVFVGHIMPKMEEKLGFTPSSRSLFGISMGGVNTTFVALHRPELFEKAVILCSPLPTISHHSSVKEMYSYFKFSSISLKRTGFKLYFSYKFFPTKENWKLNNPVEQVRQNKFNHKLPSFYISCGKKDDWDCMEGSSAFVRELKNKKHNVTWVPRDGGHCDIDHGSVARFLN